MLHRMRQCDQIGILLILTSLFCLILTGIARGSIQHESESWRQSEQKTTGYEQVPNLPLKAERSTFSAGLRMAMSLLVVSALIVASVFLLRKMTPYKGLIPNAKHHISVLSKISLGPKKSICLVKIVDEILVIGMTSTNISLLSRINANDYYGKNSEYTFEGSGAEGGRSFRELLYKMGIRNRKK